MKILNKQLHYFNPGHETAVQSGMIYYTPTASVRKMMTDLGLLPLWYGENGDYILVDESIDSSAFLNTLPEVLRPDIRSVTPADLQEPAVFQEPIEAFPWGLSPQSIRIFENIQKKQPSLAVPQWNQELTHLISRQTAAGYLEQVQRQLPEFNQITRPRFCTNIAEIKQFMSAYPPPYVLKMPYSCSGRGLYWINTCQVDTLATQWIEGAIKRQGVVSIEPVVDKVCDFALEFVSDGRGQVEYLGISIFETLEKGAFSGNRLGNQEALTRKVTKYIPDSHLQTLRQTLKDILSEKIGMTYKGHLGVDMLVYRSGSSFAVHPFIELNLRYTMGLVALQLSQRFIHPSSSGQFIVNYDKDAWHNHTRMLTTYPLQLREGKIHHGYFPLCPVSPETNYRAYILAINN